MTARAGFGGEGIGKRQFAVGRRKAERIVDFGKEERKRIARAFVDLGAFAQEAVDGTIEAAFHHGSVHRVPVCGLLHCAVTIRHRNHKFVKRLQHRAVHRGEARCCGALRCDAQGRSLGVGEVHPHLTGEGGGNGAHVNFAKVTALCHALAHDQEG